MRECFDRCGGAAARAFYFLGKKAKGEIPFFIFHPFPSIGNFVLAQEMLEQCKQANDSLGKTFYQIDIVLIYSTYSFCGGQVLLLHLWVHNSQGHYWGGRHY